MNDQPKTQGFELLTFRVADQEYSLDIMSVREIRGWTRTTPMPHAPEFMRGVINLRGTVLPVMDLARRLNLPTRETSDRNVIIVVKINGTLTGLLVDAVSDIVAMTEDDLQPPPELSSDPHMSVVRALTVIDDRMIRVLDLSAVVPATADEAA
ncbi:chemotaxis protein CheW [Pseudooceanicola nitratireducens]|jgi:purine-binding chemotaxis protein CheW|uniref:Purine-binding chemotaxis protein CheW n=1 Tax=Pseudooceanicola nitratireducens TaxID=517719 RepID=A0A1I1LDD1_9RHOB|nr:chemotaxis protein CheW [Pseudooceanicola nitratireducens]MBY6157325.1 chemotaxis protein CheW [Pseudooceanicola nitratireducens]SEJ61143.1 purine-binding chemotaxis protein CheW [Pseudooceanicola nitratireducens]SFC70522.1 purine-binding chemotaxis protein CheW [Pseudooceanicola nitratireducens]